MREIPLSQGKVALVDDRDFPFINSFKWYAKQSQSGTWYAVRCEAINRHSFRGRPKRKEKRKVKRRTIRMHNLIMNPPEGFEVHHKDGDGLINTRDNLENQTIAENRRTNYKKEKQEDYIPF